ncbi:CLUMA_CG007307, isoform A [Clunio marinus]|uniref:CLUMA_CG007307, isoform A n=1 Tax=Clunio marinus TaxID=568069 RepID=A0A1J1I0Q3_9DIPT|nr:CLUMA_CG007307, isoform A [Clunio marinus]
MLKICMALCFDSINNSSQSSAFSCHRELLFVSAFRMRQLPKIGLLVFDLYKQHEKVCCYHQLGLRC